MDDPKTRETRTVELVIKVRQAGAMLLAELVPPLGVDSQPIPIASIAGNLHNSSPEAEKAFRAFVSTLVLIVGREVFGESAEQVGEAVRVPARKAH